MTKFQKYLISISVSLLCLLGIIENDMFIKREKIYWEGVNKLQWENFRGYPNILSGFGAAINSYFTYEVLNDNMDSILVRAVMNPHHSWAREIEKNYKLGLRHEQYHFNISEAIARKFRKSLSNLPASSLNKKTIKKIYNQHISQLHFYQDKYDYDTDHSLIYERQKDWEYIIDSLLNEYSYYTSPIVTKNKKTENYTYYREIDIDGKNKIIGKFPVDSSIVQKTQHYKFYYRNDVPVKIEYWDRKKPARDPYFNVFKIKINRKSNVTEVTFYNKNSKNTTDNEGVHLIKHMYSKKKLITSYYDLEGNPNENASGIHKIIWELDYKNRKSIGIPYNIRNKKIIDKEGYCVVKFNYDKNDNVSEIINYDYNNNLLNLKSGVAKVSYQYDEQNNITLLQTFDSNLNLTPHKGKIAIENMHYDINGNVIRESFKDKNGKPVIVDKKAISYYTYDTYSNLIEESYYGLNKNLIISDDKTGKTLNTYDSLGRIIEYSNFDAYGNYLNDSYGKCHVKQYYHESNVISHIEIFHKDSLDSLSFLKTIKYEFDTDLNLLSEAYLDKEFNFNPDSNGVCIVKYENDENGNLLSVKNYDSINQLVPTVHNISSFHYKYDSKGNKIESAYFNPNNMLSGDTIGIAKDVYKYDENNKLIERQYYDSKNQLIKNANGIKIIKWSYDGNNNQTIEAYYDENGRRTFNKNKISYYTHEYDSNRNKTLTKIYNATGNLVEKEYSGIAQIHYKYNDRNQIERIIYNDKDDNLINGPEGFAIKIYSYNNYGDISRIVYLSKFKEPVVTSHGYASINWLYDNNRNVIAEIYKDENEQLIEDEDGYAIINWLHNRNGEVIESYAYNAEEANLSEINYGDFNNTVTINNYSYGISSYANNDTRVQTTYYDNGQIESEANYINGKLEGTYTTWYSTGEIESTIEYRDGKRNGLMIEFYKSGQKKLELYYDNNTFVKMTEKSWYENGNIRSEYIDGEYFEWNEDGSSV